MSNRNFRRRIPPSGRKTRPLLHCRSPSTRSRTRSSRQKNWQIKFLNRCSSEPILWTVTFFLDDEEDKKPGLLFFRPQTCTDVFAFKSLVSPVSYTSEKYREDSKVVVNVTVEGSPGPIRAMVKLGASVEETIRLVVDKYRDEGRHPSLGHDSSSFELHQSYFSLESLDKRDRIGDIGTRSFYLRKSNTKKKEEEEDVKILVSSSEFVNTCYPMIPPQLFTSLFARRMSKIGRRTKKIWKVLGCMACG